MSVMTGKIPFQTEIKPRDFTRRESIGVGFYIVSQNTNIDVTYGIPFNRATLWGATNITGLKVLVDTLSNTNLVTVKQFPTRLKECE